uniref:Coiled-coil domain-containing protein 58 n=1 Tax=Rhabditophanes sp. KR3021 TaxID=114890 RepID=A0AC35TGW9_9BILA
MRKVDDRLAFRLNCDLPTQSFAKTASAKICDEIMKEYDIFQKTKFALIEKCITENSEHLEKLTLQDAPLHEKKAAVNRLRLIKREKAVEEVVDAQSKKLLSERCQRELYR